MKTLQQGKKISHAWLGLILTCEKCEAQYQLEAGDDDLVKKIDNAYGYFYAVTCPNCKHTAKTNL